MTPPPLSRRVLLRLALLLPACTAPWAAQAQGAESYPSRPITLIVPYPAGGATDVVARMVAQRMGEGLKQPIVVENKGGANGMIGTEAVARAAPDGYTLLLTTAGAQVVAPVLFKARFDPIKSFEPISLINQLGLALVINPGVPAKNMAEFIALAKSRPLNFANGSPMIGLIGEQLKAQIGAGEMLIVPYKGTGPQTLAVLGGEADLTIDPFISLQNIRGGKMRALAVLGAKRSPSLPDVPTMAEAGVQGMNFGSWAALLAPAGTPPAIVNRLNAELLRVLALPEVKQQMAKIDYEPVGSSPAELARVIADDYARWQRVAKERNYKPQE